MVPVDIAISATLVDPFPKQPRTWCGYAGVMIARQEIHEKLTLLLHLRGIRARQQPIKIR